MPTVADYDVVRGNDHIRLSDDEVPAHDSPLETPGIKVDVRAVLSFLLNTGVPISFKTFIVNGKGKTKVGDHTIGELTISVIQTVIDAGVLQPTGNTLRIEVGDGSGFFSNIVLWYQASI
jgi:hypothetical protein